MTSKSERCCAELSGAMLGYQCSRRGSLVEKGQRYCRQHAPSAVRARSKASSKIFADLMRANELIYRRRNLEAQAFSELAATGVASPELLSNIRALVKEMQAELPS